MQWHANEGKIFSLNKLLTVDWDEQRNLPLKHIVQRLTMEFEAYNMIPYKTNNFK